MNIIHYTSRQIEFLARSKLSAYLSYSIKHHNVIKFPGRRFKVTLLNKTIRFKDFHLIQLIKISNNKLQYTRNRAHIVPETR